MEIFIGLVAVVAIGIVFLVFIGRRRGRLSAAEKRMFAHAWNGVEEELEKDPRHAVLQADILLGKVLQANGCTGSVGEMLQQAGPRFSNLNSVWEVHKLRNRIAHELHVKVAPAEGERALLAFKSALKDLGLKI